MSVDQAFARWLRETRLAAGLSQSNLEAISGIPKARLSRYENGHVVPSIQTLERLAKALGASEAVLLGDDRSLTESFAAVLEQRGVTFGSEDEAADLANAVAEIVLMFEVGDGAEPRSADAAAPAVAGLMASLHRWRVGRRRSSEPAVRG